MLLYTANYSGVNYLNGIYGSVMEMGEAVNTYAIVPIIFMLAFLYSVFNDEKLKNRFTIFQNIVMVVVLLIIAALIFTSLYVQNTFYKVTIIRPVRMKVHCT